MVGLQGREGFMISLAVLILYRRVTNGQTRCNSNSRAMLRVARAMIVKQKITF